MSNETRSALTLELGRRYVRRDGVVTGPLGDHNLSSKHPFVDRSSGEAWTRNGVWHANGPPHPKDITALYQELDPCTGMPRCDGVILTDEIAKADAPQKRVKRKVWLQIYNDASLQVRSSSEHAAMMSNSAITCRLCLDIDIPECTGLSEEFVVEVRK